MFNAALQWENSYAIAASFMTPEKLKSMYEGIAFDMEKQGIHYMILGKHKESERIYITIGQPDMAINMYKNIKNYENLIRLVTQYHRDQLLETHMFLAKELEAEGRIRQAEYHFIEGKDWKSAVAMYCKHNVYEEAYRVHKMITN